MGSGSEYKKVVSMASLPPSLPPSLTDGTAPMKGSADRPSSKKPAWSKPSITILYEIEETQGDPGNNFRPGEGPVNYQPTS